MIQIVDGMNGGGNGPLFFVCILYSLLILAGLITYPHMWNENKVSTKRVGTAQGVLSKSL
jgi:hypothetical protein